MDSFQLIIICCNEERRRFQEKQMRDLELPYVFFDAYTPETMGDYITKKNTETPEADTTLCCTRSHIEALKMFVEQFSDKEYVVIAEDDIILIHNFKEELHKTLQIYKKYKEIDYITLGCSPDQKEKPASPHSDGNVLWGPMIVWSATLQIIPMSIAKQMVDVLDVKNTAEVYDVIYKKIASINNGKGYAYKQIRLQSDAIFSILWRQASIWPPMAIENEAFNSCITPQITNNRWQYIFDLNIRKKEEFYTPIELSLEPYVINLYHRKDRWEEVQREFQNLQIIPYRIDAVFNVDDGAKGCMASHIVALTEGIKTNKPIWVCEDDIEFLTSPYILFKTIDEFLKSDADILCLGNNVRKRAKYTDTFYRAVETQTTSSYVIKPAFATILRNHWQEMSEYLAQGKTHFSEVLFRKTDMYGKNSYHCCDINWKILQQFYTFLVPVQRCLRQRESYSDITKTVAKYEV
jgi:GR25 family glycosyltransferase involved in LPS biosynthesis